MHGSEKQLEFNKYADAAIDFLAQCTSGPSRVCFIGGEPLCHKDAIVDIVSRFVARYPQIHFGCRTNMVAADHEFLLWAKKIGLHIGASFGGCRVAHDTYRINKNQESTFDAVDENIRSLIDINRGQIQIIGIPVSPLTVKYLVESYKHCRSIGAKRIHISAILNADWSQLDIEQFASSMDCVADEIIDDYRSGHGFFLSNIASILHNVRNGDVSCGAGRSYIGINMRGEITPCQNFASQPKNPFVFGRVDTGTIDMKAIFAYNQAARRAIEVQGCCSCPFSSQGCRSFCAGDQLLGRCNGKPSVDTLGCTISRIHIRMAKKLYRALSNNAYFIRDYEPRQEAMKEFIKSPD